MLNWRRFNFGEKKDLFLVIGMLGILLVLFTPIPSGLLDFLLVTNFSFGILILMLTFYSEKPLDFSTFPSLLLITTLFRLSLNIAATRLILSDADAGAVINAVGAYVVGGNYVIGMVVFLILVVVQYVVVTNGAQRVAEVAARFTLDSMPGKQMSIDADLNMGLIDGEEARQRRSGIEKEANFYGAMDGASKFVKGDAIAGIIIILIDIIGGLSIGIVQHGMSWGDALHTYTLLTVGDGIVTQIPSLVVAVATGIIITRAATDSHLGYELINQVTSHPKTLVIVASALFAAMFLPGLPVLPLLMLFMLFSMLAFFSYRKKRNPESAVEEIDNNFVTNKTQSDNIYDVMHLYPLEITLGEKLVRYVESNNSFFKKQFSELRNQFAREYGIVLPEVKLTEDALLDNCDYRIAIDGVIYGKGKLVTDKKLAINPGGVSVELEGEQVKEPAYNLPATWVDESMQDNARASGYTTVDPKTLLITHFNEVVKRNASELLSRSETERLIERVKGEHAGLVEELIPNLLTFTDVQAVLKELLKERVSVRRIVIILETLVDCAKEIKDKFQLAELVRQKLGGQITQKLKDNDENLHVLTINPELERTLIKSMADVGGKASLMVEPDLIHQLVSSITNACERMLSKKHNPIIVCAPPLRKPFKQFLDRVVPNVTVLSMSEIPESTSMKAFESIQVT